MRRAVLLVVLVLCGGVVAVAAAEARPWRRGPPGWGYHGWGWDPWWGYPLGGWYGPDVVWYVPPLVPEPSYVPPRKRCRAGRTPARWVRTRKDGRIVYVHVMSRCR